jgi:uncharacterized damage-inducible protein DinB
MPDPILTSARAILRSAREDLHAAVDGLPAAALTWRPAGDDTNSIATLASHSLLSARAWLSVAVDEPVGDRDRDAEFDVTAAGADQLLAFAGGLFDECLDLIDKDRTVDWGAMRQHWDPGRDIQMFAAWALIHALEHLREHIGHIGLTRQLWDAANSPESGSPDKSNPAQ